MNRSFAALERQRLARCRLLAELRYRRLPRPGGWSHCGEQFGTEPTSLALLALHSSSSASTVTRKELEPLLACQRPNGLWPAVGDGAADVSFWASAIAVNTLMILGAAPETFAGALDSLVNCRPLEASWLVRLKFRLSDRQVRFDPTKYGWAWVPDTVSWVVPTSMALIALERAKRQGLIRGSELQKRLRLGVEMLLDRVCPGGGWNAGNAVVYGVPLRPHVDATRDCTCRVTIPPRPADSPRFSDLDLESDRLPFSVQPGLGDPFSCRVQGLEVGRLAGARYGTRPSRCTGRRSESKSRTHRRSRWPLSPWNLKPRSTRWR